MIRALLFSSVCLFVLLSCSTQRMICPAYQSAFYFDKSKQKDAFVFYNENKNQPREIVASNNKTINLPPRDSSWDQSHVLPGPALPFERKRKKEKYLLLPRRTYKEALRAMQTVPMKPVYPKIGEDSTDIKKALDSAARSVTDTITKVAAPNKVATAEDSVYVITKEKEKFNLDQDNYMWYFRDILVLPDVRIAMAEAKAEKEGPKETKKKKGFFASLKGLFKKKPKEKTTEQPVLNDSTQVNSNPQDSSTVVQQPKKKGLLGMFKKKQKPVAAPKKIEGKKEEDDGF